MGRDPGAGDHGRAAGPAEPRILARISATAYPGLANHLAPLAVAEKRAWTVADVDGNVYLDCASASASVPLGAGRPELLEPAVEALRTFGNEDSHALASELTAELGERLLDVAPGSLSRYDIALNGTEAVEIAIKIMRRATGRPVILAFHGSYHGESTMTAALGAEAAEISSGLRGLVPGFVHVPYPHPYRTPFRDPRPGGSGDATVDYIRDHVLFHALDPADVAGVVIEPVLGSGGCVAPPDPFWPALTELCHEHGWLPVRRRGQDRDGSRRPPVRGRALGSRARPGLPRQGARRRGDADRGTARDRGARSAASTTSPPAAPGPGCPAPAPPRWRRSTSTRPSRCSRTCAELERLASDPARRAPRSASSGSATCARSAAFRRSSSSATARRPSSTSSCRRRSRARHCGAGLLTDSSTTTLNIQPSLVMPAEALDRALAIIAESIGAALAAEA